MKRKVLYLADRNNLVDQSIQQDFAPLKQVIHKINMAKDGSSTIISHEMYFSLYQQLMGDIGDENFRKLFRPASFDLIIVDGCHRGVCQGGEPLAAGAGLFQLCRSDRHDCHPRETKYVSNINYFAESQSTLTA